MTNDEEVLSPPYPGEGTTTHRLHGFLCELRAWASSYRAKLGVAEIPEVGRAPSWEAYRSSSVPSQFRTLMFMRKLREGWDEIVRTHEADWDTESCRRKQAVVVGFASQHLASAAVSFELREARDGEGALEFLSRNMEALSAALVRMWEPVHDQEAVRATGP